MPDNSKKLQEKAKRRGIKNFRAKTEAELRKLLEKRGTKSHPISAPIFQPEIMEKVTPSFIEKTVKTFSGWMNWLAESGQKYIIKPITSTLKNIKKKSTKYLKKKKKKKEEFKLKEGKSALKMFARQFTIDGKPCYDPQTFFEAIRGLVLEILRKNKNIKLKLILNCKMKRINLRTDEIVKVDAEFHSEIETNLEGKDENKLFDTMIARIDENIANFQRRGSNWVFVSINQLEIHLHDWKPLGGSSFISLPKKIRNKGAVINMKNDDGVECRESTESR